MTDKDVYETLHNIREIIDYLSKTEIKRILEILISNQQKHRCVFFNSVDLVRYTKRILKTIMKSDDLVGLFDKKQMKTFYTILSDHDICPICPLCGQPIMMQSNNHATEFSWDHIIPKSLGGVNDLFNLQPTHKECNNRKGNDILYHVHYKIVVDIDVDVKAPGIQKKNYPHRKDYRHKMRNFYCYENHR